MWFNKLNKRVMSNQNYISSLFLRKKMHNASSIGCYAFRRDVRKGIAVSFGNTVSGYSLTLNGTPFNTSECVCIAEASSYGTAGHIVFQKQIIGNLFEHSVKVSLFKDVRTIVYDRLAQIAASGERKERNVSADGLFDFSISNKPERQLT